MQTPGTNFFADLNNEVKISLTNESGFAVLADCIGNPNVVALQADRYNTGCLMVRNDVLSGDNLYQNTGTLAIPIWTLVGGGGTWTPQGPTTSATVGGIPTGTDLGILTIPIEQTLLQIFYPASGPTVSLATTPASGLVEAGDVIASVDLTPTTTQGTLPITTLTLSGTDGYAYAYPAPSPSGATEPTQTDGTGFVITTTYTATVGDGTYTGTATKTFTYVFPYYKGVDVKTPEPDFTGDGGSLTKVVTGNPFTLTLSFTTVAQVPYLVYPASYGKLKKVLDASNFDVSTDWGTQPGGPNTDITPYFTTSPITVTNSFGATASCYVYQFKNVTTTTQQYTFSQ